MNVVLEKYQGLGNDYLVFDPNKNELELTEKKVALICNRNFGVGADGILEGPISDGSHIYMKIWNPDGSQAQKSGNGVRIFAKYLKDAGYVQKTKVTIMTIDGPVYVQYLNEDGTRLKAEMGKLTFWSDEIPVTGERREVINEMMVFGKLPYKDITCVSVGNPHCVILMDEISKELVCKIGKHSEHAVYFPERINTILLKVIDRTHIQVEIFERGAGYTLASGSCGSAAAGAAHRMGLTDRKMYVQMPGGILEVEILEDNMVIMTGDVGYIGTMSLADRYIKELQLL